MAPSTFAWSPYFPLAALLARSRYVGVGESATRTAVPCDGGITETTCVWVVPRVLVALLLTPFLTNVEIAHTPGLRPRLTKRVRQILTSY